ncbi:MAG: cation diffusion facilitator family transporter [Thermoplasmata archaeon]|nr:cation diffusion facilitator family transporter [Thermoplasmata archaeon]
MRPQVVIVGTIVLDAILFVLNLIVAAQTGSHAVLSQAVYSITDLAGGVFLLGGFVAARRPPTREHPFGHGKERFFWAFTASLVAFSVAGLLVLTSGVQQVLSPAPVTHLDLALFIVGGTLAVSLASIEITLRELRRDATTIASLLESAHQGLKTIFYQDLVSVLGSVVAFGGIAVVYVTHNPRIDGWTAAIVGVVLIAMGFVLAAENREYLIGKALSPEATRPIIQVAEKDVRVRKVRSVQSMMLGPDDVLVAMRINFQNGLTTDQIEQAIDELGQAMRQAFPALRHLIIEPES